MAGGFGSVCTERIVRIVFFVIFTTSTSIHDGALLNTPQRHLLFPSTSHNYRVNSIAVTNRGGDICKQGSKKCVQNSVAFGEGHFRGAEGSDAVDMWHEPFLFVQNSLTFLTEFSGNLKPEFTNISTE